MGKEVSGSAINIRVVLAWMLLVSAIGFQASLNAADSDKEVVPDKVKEKIVEDAKEKEDSGKKDVGEASYNVQDCHPDETDGDTAKERTDGDKNVETEVDVEPTDELDECEKVVK